MAQWDTGVTPPPVRPYSGAGSIFSALSNWGQDDPYAQAEKQRQYQLARAFPNGLPIGPDGQPDIRAMAQTLAQFGDPGAAAGLIPAMQQQQAQSNVSGLLGGGGQAPAPGGLSPAYSAPQPGNASPAAAPATAAPTAPPTPPRAKGGGLLGTTLPAWLTPSCPEIAKRRRRSPAT